MKLSSPSQVDRRLPAAGAVIVWIAVSPWVWGFAGAHPAIANHVFLVLGFGPLALIIGALRPAALVTIGGGVWLAVSPWILGYSGNHLAWVNELITGALLVALAAGPAGLTGRVRQRPRLEPAGREATGGHQ
jgi:SPW repeat